MLSPHKHVAALKSVTQHHTDFRNTSATQPGFQESDTDGMHRAKRGKETRKKGHMDGKKRTESG
jgi:hypothetical protein